MLPCVCVFACFNVFPYVGEIAFYNLLPYFSLLAFVGTLVFQTVLVDESDLFLFVHFNVLVSYSVSLTDLLCECGNVLQYRRGQARGVTGSGSLMKIDNKDQDPDKYILEHFRMMHRNAQKEKLCQFTTLFSSAQNHAWHN